MRDGRTAGGGDIPGCFFLVLGRLNRLAGHESLPFRFFSFRSPEEMRRESVFSFREPAKPNDRVELCFCNAQVR